MLADGPKGSLHQRHTWLSFRDRLGGICLGVQSLLVFGAFRQVQLVGVLASTRAGGCLTHGRDSTIPMRSEVASIIGLRRNRRRRRRHGRHDDRFRDGTRIR
jgi:hypothetical protein